MKGYRYARGSVWWVRKESLPCYEGSSTQTGARPVVVISNNERGHSTIVEVVTMTTAEKSQNYPMINVECEIEGRTTYVQCNQHFTLPLSTLCDYYCTLSSELMKRVDKSLMYCQGLCEDPFEDKFSPSQNEREKSKESKESQEVCKRKRWTEDEIKEFVSDLSEKVLSEEELMSKYGYATPKSMMNTYYRLRKKLEE